MPNNDHQRTRRCIAKTKRGSQCNNSVDCPYHRCEKSDCEEEALHTRRDIPLTPLNLRQEHYLTRKRTNGMAQGVSSRSIPDPISTQSTRTKTASSKHTSSNNTIGNKNRSMQARRPETTRFSVVRSGSLDGSGKCDTIAVPSSPYRTQSIPIPDAAQIFCAALILCAAHIPNAAQFYIFLCVAGNPYAAHIPYEAYPDRTHVSQRQRVGTIVDKEARARNR